MQNFKITHKNGVKWGKNKKWGDCNAETVENTEFQNEANFNWLNYYVYQDTPYDLGELKDKR